MIVDAELTFWRDSTADRHCVVYARMYDRARGAFYGGSGSSPLEAIAWCLDEYVQRGVLERGPLMARDPGARPGDFRETTTADDELRIAGCAS